MGNLLTTSNSKKETTSREREYASSFSQRRYNTEPAIFAASPPLEKKELPRLPQWKSSESPPLKYKASQPTTYRSSKDLDTFWEDILASHIKAQTIKQERTYGEREYTSSLSHSQYNTGPRISVANPLLEKKELPKVSRTTTQLSSRVLRVSTTLDPRCADTILASQTKAKVSKQEKISKVKENTISLPHRPNNPAIRSERNTTFGIKNDVSLLGIEGNLTDSEKEDVKKITEIVRHILRNKDKFVGIYGNWSCRRWPSLCNNEDEWQNLLNKISLESYLKLTPEEKLDFFKRPCKECNKENLISSFFLCKKRPTYAENTVEIICRLEWNNHYRVFADWKCQRPDGRQHIWKSSYTWISLQKFIEKASTDDFRRADFYKQNCHECREMCNNCKNKPKKQKYRGCAKCNYEGVITNYGCLVLSGGGKPHKRWLCAKCQGGAICVRTDDNRRVRRDRNIVLY